MAGISTIIRRYKSTLAEIIMSKNMKTKLLIGALVLLASNAAAVSDKQLQDEVLETWVHARGIANVHASIACEAITGSWFKETKERKHCSRTYKEGDRRRGICYQVIAAMQYWCDSNY